MKIYEPANIRNIALLGHTGTGKTTLAETLLFNAKSINRRGTVEDRNTVSDYHELEQERANSIFSVPMYLEYKNKKINIIDSPGFDDYIGEAISAAYAADVGVITLNSQNGIEVGTDNLWEQCKKMDKPVCFVINKIDVEQAKFDENIDLLKNRFGGSATIIQYPTKVGAQFHAIIDLLSMSMFDYKSEGGHGEKKDIPADEIEKAENLRNELIESIAETNEDLMNKYLETEALDDSDIINGLKNAIALRQIFPILTCSSKQDKGVDIILDFFSTYLPSPADLPNIVDKNGTSLAVDANAQTSIFVFKMLSESHLGDMTFFRVMSGKLQSGMDLVNETNNSTERFNALYIVSGKKRQEVDALMAGDIGASVKLKSTHVNNTLHVKGFNVEYKYIEYPNPKVRIAVVPKTKGEEEKVGMGLHAIHEEDLSLVVEHSQELRQMLCYGQGELHLQVAKWKLENRFKVQTQFIEPRVPYRETIQKKAQGSYRHKKQSGGAGQFAEVYMIIEPYTETPFEPGGLSVRAKDLIELKWGGYLEYINCIVGGVIDQRFLPAILKGVMDKMEFGPLTGSYVRDIRVVVHDGKMHPVDSNEAAFKTAGMMVFKEIFAQANPKILEPIYLVKVKVPDDYVGDVMSDMPTRRGLILGVDAEVNNQIINARMPLAELDKYSTALRSMTQGKASYNSEFIEYQAVPANVQQDLIDAYKKQQEEEA